MTSTCPIDPGAGSNVGGGGEAVFEMDGARWYSEDNSADIRSCKVVNWKRWFTSMHTQKESSLLAGIHSVRQDSFFLSLSLF